MLSGLFILIESRLRGGDAISLRLCLFKVLPLQASHCSFAAARASLREARLRGVEHEDA